MSSLQPWETAPRRPSRPLQCWLGAPGPGPGLMAAPVPRSPPHRPGPTRHEPGSREPPQHFGGPPPLISPKPQHPAVPTALWNPVSLMDSSLEPRRAPEGHPLHGHPAPFEPSRPAAVPLVKVERVYCPEKVEEGPRKREAAPLDKYPPPPREPGSLETQAFPPGPGPFLAELEPAAPTVLGQPRASLAPPATFGEPPGPLKPGSPYRPPPSRGPDAAYVYDELLQRRRRLVSKLDLEERRRREAQEKGLLPPSLLRQVGWEAASSALGFPGKPPGTGEQARGGRGRFPPASPSSRVGSGVPAQLLLPGAEPSLTVRSGARGHVRSTCLVLARPRVPRGPPLRSPVR